MVDENCLYSLDVYIFTVGCQTISPHIYRFKIGLYFLSVYDDYSLVDDLHVSHYMVPLFNANSDLNKFGSDRKKSPQNFPFLQQNKDSLLICAWLKYS